MYNPSDSLLDTPPTRLPAIRGNPGSLLEPDRYEPEISGLAESTPWALNVPGAPSEPLISSIAAISCRRMYESPRFLYFEPPNSLILIGPSGFIPMLAKRERIDEWVPLVDKMNGKSENILRQSVF